MKPEAQETVQGTLRFGVYEADPRSGELRKHGLRVPLEEKPFQALVILLQHANEIVTREEFRQQLWPADIFIDFPHSLNTVIAKARRALNDSAEKPRYIETVGRHGYRFIEKVVIEMPKIAAPVVLQAVPRTAGSKHRLEDASGAIVGSGRARRNVRRIGMGVAVVAAVLALAVGTAYWVSSRPRSTQPPADRSVRDAGSRVAPSSSSAAAPDVEPSYQIDTALYRMHGVSEDRLRPGSRVAPGDNLFAKVRVSVPAYVYIVNEDDRGESYLLFPLPGQTLINPLPAGTTHRIPGVVGNEQVNWQVTSAGGREHFLIFASPERLPAFEQMFAALPRPEIGKPIRSAPLSAETIGHLRGIGGLTSGAVGQTFAARLTQQFPTPLGDSAETARGLWVRQFTVDNPTK